MKCPALIDGTCLFDGISLRCLHCGGPSLLGAHYDAQSVRAAPGTPYTMPPPKETTMDNEDRRLALSLAHEAMGGRMAAASSTAVDVIARAEAYLAFLRPGESSAGTAEERYIADLKKVGGSHQPGW